MSDEHKPVVHQEQPSVETAPKPTEKTQTMVRQSQTRFEATSGFLPPPSMLAEYEKTSPGITDWFLKTAEREMGMEELAQKSEIQINIKLADAYIKDNQTSRMSAGILLGFFGILAFILAFTGNNLGAGILLSVAVISGIKALLPNTTNKEATQESNSQEQKQLPPTSDSTK
jgi:uncharacterized membrane protein